MTRKKLGMPVMLKPTLLGVCLEQLHRRAPALLRRLPQIISGQLFLRLLEKKSALPKVFLVVAIRHRHAISIDA